MTDAGVHHLHKRKRKMIKKNDDIPLEQLKEKMDKFIYVACIAAPLLAAPQAWKIWSQQNAGGISLVTYVGFLFINVTWIIYGLLHKEKPVILLYSSLFVVNSIIAVGRVIYG